MAHIEMYTRPFCPYCARARQLLDAKGLDYTDFDIWADSAIDAQMRERSGRTSVPQIFIDGHHVGGSDELAAAADSGLLDQLLGRAA